MDTDRENRNRRKSVQTKGEINALQRIPAVKERIDEIFAAHRVAISML